MSHNCHVSASGLHGMCCWLVSWRVGVLARVNLCAPVSSASCPCVCGVKILHAFVCCNHCHGHICHDPPATWLPVRATPFSPRLCAARAYGYYCCFTEACLNALSLLDEYDAWLDMGCDPWVRAHTLPGPPPPPLFPQPPSSHTHDAGGVLGSAGGACLTLNDLRREYAVMRAAAAVAVSSSGGAGGNPLQQATLPPSELLGALLTAGQVRLCGWVWLVGCLFCCAAKQHTVRTATS